jgi:hypothetical protein
VSCKEGADTSHGERHLGSLAPLNLDLAEAMFRLGWQANPECPNWLRSRELVALANRLVDAGAEGPAICALAALAPAAPMSDAAPLFERALRDLGRPALSSRQAHYVLIREIAIALTTGELRPSTGAADFSFMFADGLRDLDVLLPFVAIMSDYDDLPHRRSKFDVDIVEAAHALLARLREEDLPALW